MKTALGFRRVFWLAMAVLAVGLLTIGSADAQTTYGVSVSKGCNSPTYVGQPYQCFFVFANTNPSATSGDTVKLVSVIDAISTAGGTVTSANILPGLNLVGSPTPPGTGAPSCTGPGISGSGTVASPWVGATACTLPRGASLTSLFFSHYNPTVADFNATANHKLNDQATYGWFDLCDKTPEPGTCDATTSNSN